MRRTFMFLILIVLVIGHAQNISAGRKDGDGHEVLKKCSLAVKVMSSEEMTDPDILQGVSCLSMLYGINIINRVEQEMGNNRLLFCLPPGMTNGQLTQTVVRYLNNYPDWLHLTDSVLLVMIFKDAFPCRK